MYFNLDRIYSKNNWIPSQFRSILEKMRGVLREYDHDLSIPIREYRKIRRKWTTRFDVRSYLKDPHPIRVKMTCAMRYKVVCRRKTVRIHCIKFTRVNWICRRALLQLRNIHNNHNNHECDKIKCEHLIVVYDNARRGPQNTDEF